MIFRLDSEVLKNGVLPETFHVVLSSSLSDTYSMAFLGSCSTKPYAPNYRPARVLSDNGCHILSSPLPLAPYFSGSPTPTFPSNSLPSLPVNPEGKRTRSAGLRKCLISNEVIQIFSAPLRTQMPTWPGSSGKIRRLLGNCRASRTGSAPSTGGAFYGDGGGKHEGRGIVSSETYAASGGGNISIQSGEGVVGTSGTHLASSNPYRCMRISLQNSNESRRGAHLSMTTAGVWLAISMKLETN